METWSEDIAEVEKPAEPLALELDRARREIAEGHMRMHQMEGFFNHVADVIFIAEPDGRVIDVNPAACALLLYSREELLAMSLWDFDAGASRGAIINFIQNLRPGEPVAVERTYRTRDGAEKFMEVRATRCALGGRDLVIISGRDATQKKWTEALLEGEKQLLEVIARGAPLTPTLAAICRVVEEVSPGAMCSILLLDASGQRLLNGAAPSLPKSYLDAINNRPIAPGDGPCARAAFHRKSVIVPDIAALPPGAEYRELALAHGLRACWSTPILSTDDKVLGAFAVYSKTPGTPTPQQYQLIGQITHLASVAIERKRADDALRRSEAYLAEAQRLSRTGSFGWNVATGELVWSRETYHIVGLESGTKPTLETVFNLTHPDDRQRLRNFLDRAIRDGTDLDFHHRLLLPGGAVKHLHVVAHASLDESNRLEYIGAVMDITGSEKTGRALRASERLARGQVEALTDTLDVMSMETNPDRLVEYVLRTIVGQIGAHSSSIWLKDELTDLMIFECALEDNRLKTRGDSALANISPSSPMDAHWPWPEVMRTGKPFVIEDMRQGPEVPWRRHLLDQGIITILIVPLLVTGKTMGVMGIRFTTSRVLQPEETELAQALANQAMLAIQLMRLSRRSREAAVVAERNRMARDIHDTLAQGFTGVIVQLEAAEDAISQGLTAETNRHLEQAGEVARQSLREARRSVQALRPQALDEKNLCDALDELIHKMTDGTSVRVEFAVEGGPRQRPSEWDDNLLRIGQEVLTNALRHARATTFKTRLVFDSDEIRMELSDNGRGFDPARRHDGFGLRGIRERVESMGGQLRIDSAEGNGTAITITLPLPEDTAVIQS